MFKNLTNLSIVDYLYRNSLDLFMNIIINEGGIMKIFITNTWLTFLAIGISQAMIFSNEPSRYMAAYDNKISQISYSLGSDDQHAITFLCQQSPICMYTPLTYEQSSADSLTKTYFLPRMKNSNSKMNKFYHDLELNLKKIGIDLKVDEIEDVNYGLQMSFTTKAEDAYDIIKVIDADKKTVRFDIVAKI